MGGGGGTDHGAIYDAALQRRQALMGASGARALVKNWKVFRVAAFACIGGILYGYNQGMFSSVLAMPSFKLREYSPHTKRDMRRQIDTPSAITRTIGFKRMSLAKSSADNLGRMQTWASTTPSMRPRI